MLLSGVRLAASFFLVYLFSFHTISCFLPGGAILEILSR
jgi:hypothetical protein